MASALENSKDIVTMAGVILGIAGAAWKWIFSETIRRLKEIPAIDGNVKIESQPDTTGWRLVTVIATWRNRGVQGVFIDPKTATFSYNSIDNISDITTDPGKIITQTFYVDKPLSEYIEYILEPNTESEISSVVRLRSNDPFLVTVNIEMETKKHGNKTLVKWGFMRRIVIGQAPLSNSEAAMPIVQNS